MSLYENLPVYRQALDLTAYFETIVRHFEKYHKYTVGADLRNLSRRILILVAKANTKSTRAPVLIEAIGLLDELKIDIRICKEIKAFRSFKQYECATRKTDSVVRQCEGWLRCRNSSNASH